MIKLKTLKDFPDKIDKKELITALKTWFYIFDTEPKKFYEQDPKLIDFGDIHGDYKVIKKWLNHFVGD